MPSVYSFSIARPRPSSTVITPSLPTLSITSAISSPISPSAAEIEATCAICSLVSTGILIDLISSITASVPFSNPLRRIIGFAPAARFFKPSVIMACASTVAVVVPSPATSFVLVATSLSSCAPMFSKGSGRSMSRAMVTPSLVMVGEPYFLSSTTLRPFGPSVTFTAPASTSIPLFRDCRACSSNCSRFATKFTPLINNTHDIALAQNQILFTVLLNLSSGILREEHLLPNTHFERGAFAIVQYLAGANRQDFTLLRLLLGCIRQHDPALGDGLAR